MKRTLLFVGAVLILLGNLIPITSALTPTYTVSGAYKNSVYYENVLTVTHTGDQAFDAVAAALSQLNYHEGNSAADYHGKNGSGSKNYTEYNRALGSIGGTYSYAWCAAFVTWCLEVAGAGSAAGGKFASCTLWVERLQELGLYSTRSSGYTPKAGDLIFFRSAGVSRASDHVGLVRYVKNGRVYTVEGNSSNKVTTKSYALSDTYIVGYGKPQYGGVRLGATALSLEDNATGLYTVTNDFVNVRAKNDASSSKLGTLSCGTLVTVSEIKNGWGKIEYAGKTAYISLEYADFTAPIFYTVTYDSDGGQGSPKKQSYYSFKTATVSDVVPQKEGYSFVKWESSDGKSYVAGEALPQGDTALKAVWEVLPNVEAPPEGEGASTPENLVQSGGFWGSGAVTDGTFESGSMGEESMSATARATVKAGTISGMLAAVCALLWYARRFLA